MKKVFLCLLFILSIFTISTQAFEGLHERDGEFIIYEKNEDMPELFYATHLSTAWENGLVKYYYNEMDGTQIRITKADNDDYVQLQLITIEPTTFVLKRDCLGHSYPVELEGYQTKEIIPAGTYTVNKYFAGWYGILLENGENVWVCPNLDENYNYINGKNATFEESQEILQVNEIHEIPVSVEYLLTSTNHSVRPGYAMKPLYVTIHNTANTKVSADALSHAMNQYNRQDNNNVWTSWHFQVDDHSIYQSIPMNETVWSEGDGTMMGNSSSISIEICENTGGNYIQAEINAAYLAAQILYECGLPSDAIKMHYDWSSKECPRNLIDGTRGSMGWENFKLCVKEYYDYLVDGSQNETYDEEFISLIQESDYKKEFNVLYNIPSNMKINDFIQQFQKNETIKVQILNKENIEVTKGRILNGYKMILTN